MNRDRLSWMRFLGFALGDRTPDENTIRHFRNRMTETGTLKRVMKAFDWQLHKKGGILCRGRLSMPAWCQRPSSATPMMSGKSHQGWRSEEHTSELQSLMRISYAVFCLKKQKHTTDINY